MIKLRRIYIAGILLAALSLTRAPAWGAIRTTVTSGNWNAAATWGGTVPSSTDDARIASTHTVTVTANATCASLTFTGAGGILSVNSGVTLTVTGTAKLNNQNNNATATISGAGTLSCSSFDVGTTTSAIGSSNRTYTHTLTSTIANLNITNNLTVISAFATTNRYGNGRFYLQEGAATIGGSVVTDNINANNSAVFSMAQGSQTGTLNIGGATAFNPDGTGTTTITLNGTSSLVNYNRSGAQTVYYNSSTSSTSYTNLTLSGSGVKTISSSSLSVTGIMSMEGTATAGTNTPSYGSASTLQYKGSAAQATGTELPATFGGSGGIIINNSSGVALSSSVAISYTLTLTSGSFSVGSYTLSLNGPAIAGTPSNLATTSASSLSFGGSSTGIAIPSSVTDLKNLTVNNSSGVAMNSDIALSSSGVLTLTSGLLNAGSHGLSITNTASSSVTASSSSFVNVTTGNVTRTLASGISSAGTDYLFPVGENSAHKALNLVDVITGTTGPVLRVTVSATGATTGDNVTIGPVDPRYWSMTNVNSGDLTSASIELFETGLDESKTLGMSSAASGVYTSIGGVNGTSSMTSPTVTAFSQYFCIGSIYYDTYYSYQTGDWHSYSTWTSDPSGTLQIGSTVPDNNAKVVILSDRTVSLSSDVTETMLKVIINSGGILDISDNRFTNSLYYLKGQGTLRLASDDFPQATSNTFVSSGGGTTEYYNGSDITLASSQETYNNLTINCSGYTATQLDDIVINGNLYIKSGTFRVNDNVSTTKLNLTVNGNVSVDNGAYITVGNGVTNTSIGSTATGGTAPFLNYYLNFHTIILKGNFTNNGTVKFTNLDYPLFTAFPPVTPGSTSGAASVFFQGNADNSLTCNGPTTFYNLIINKGSDHTYKLTVTSSAYGNFRLFGANSLAAEAVSANPSLRKSLWIYSGTLVLKGSLAIPSLSEGTVADADYYIPSNGALQIDGINTVVLSTADDYREVNVAYGVSAPDNATIGITKGGYSALHVLGRFEIDNGFLSARESGGIITSSVASGQVVIDGGTVDAKQFLSSAGTASYSQSGGLLVLRGRLQRVPSSYGSVSDLKDVTISTLGTSRATNGISTAYGSFNLENSANYYSVSGGTIRVYDVTLDTGGEAFDVKSSVSNTSVTGGSLEIIPVAGSVLPDAAYFSINSTAPVHDLTINRAGSTSDARLSSALEVKNDFSLTAGTLVANNNNLTVEGDFTVGSGTAYTPGTNTTSLNGPADQLLTIDLASPLSLYHFTITKSAGAEVSLAGSQGTLNVTGNFSLAAGTLNDSSKTINISGDVFNSGLHRGAGSIVLNGTSAQAISGAGIFQNITMNNTNAAAAPVSLTANMTVNGVLTFSNDKLFNIGTYNLLLNSSASISGNGSARYIQTAGNTGDGGLTKVYSPTATEFTFPVGAPTLTPSGAVKYTPATIGFSEAPAAYGSVTVVPVGYEHPVVSASGQSLTYFWRVKSSGFAGIPLYSVTHEFVYGSSDVAGTESNYVPALYDGTAYEWYYGRTSDINTSTNTISDWTLPTNSTNFLDADYTAGASGSFTSPTVYYSYQTGVWSTTSTWSLTSHTVIDVPSAAPGANDIVVIGGNDSIYLSAEPALPTDNSNPGAAFYRLNKATVNCASLQVASGSVLDIQNNPGCTFASVLDHPGGNGKIRITTRHASFDQPSSFVFPSGDFSDFNAHEGISEFYTINPQAGTYYILPSGTSAYGTVILKPYMGSNIIMPNISAVTISGDLICNGSSADAWLAMSWNGGTYGTVVAKKVTVNGDLKVYGGSFVFAYNNTTLQEIDIDGDVRVLPGAGIDVAESTENNIMTIGGSVYNNSDNSEAPLGTFSMVRFLNGTNNCDVTFDGNNSSFLTNDPSLSTTPVTILGNVTVDKGTTADSTLTWDIGGTLTTPDDGWLTLLNGTLVYEREGDFYISEGTDFTIPSTAGLTLNTASDVYLANNAAGETLYLDGKLTIGSAGGNVYIGPEGNTTNNADIEYSGSGASAIGIEGGNLFINGQVRRPVATTNGILSYSQSGGNVVIYGNNANIAKAKLEVLNSGSDFSMTGGTLTIVRGSGTTYGDLYLRPSTSTVTGGTIVFSQVPDDGPGVDADQSYKLDADVALNSLVIRGKTTTTTRNATLTLMVSPLEINDSLVIDNSNSLLVSNDIDVSVGGDMKNNGTYTHGTNTTTFDGTLQEISGTSVTGFNNMVVSSVTSLGVNHDFTVDNDLTINSGNLALGSYNVTLMGDFTNEGSYSDDNLTGGVILAGASQQSISGSGYFSRLVLNNMNGAELLTNITVNGDLVLTTGALDISQYLLTLGQNSQFGGAPFSVANMITTDGAPGNPGVLKYINTGGQVLTFPIGSSAKYTPAVFDIDASLAVAYIRVNPVDDHHVSVLDPMNALDYYWQVESSGLSGFDATAEFIYHSSDVEGTESDYVAASFNSSSGAWVKAPAGPLTDNVDEINHRVRFVFSDTTDIAGDYTAGSDAAIPDSVGTYQTNANGNWSDESIWTPVGATPACPAGGPSGCNIIIDHVVTTDINNITALSCLINGTLRVVSPTFGHNIGVVDGNGTIYLQGGNLPAGTYTDFLDCSGDATVEYGGSGSYTVVATLFSSLPNVKFSETGTRVLPNKDLTICKSLVIDGPTLDNSVNNRKLEIEGTMERYNTGAFRCGTGSAPSATVSFTGSSAQVIGGATGDFTGSDKFNNLEINNEYGLTIGDNGSVEVNNVLLLTNGIITTSSTNRLTLLNVTSSAVSPDGGSAGSHVDGPLEKYISDGESFNFPLGKDAVKGHDFTLTATGGSTLKFTAEFFTPNTTATSLADPLKATNTSEFWSVFSTTTTTAKVKIGWDPGSDLTPLVTANGITDMRVAEFLSGEWTELSSTTSGDDYNGDVSTSGNTPIFDTAASFTTGAVAATLARAALDPGTAVCSSYGIPLTFTSFDPINLNYTLDYTYNGVPQSTKTVTSLPYTLPTPAAGNYALTAFKHDNGTVAGVVDPTVVTVYADPSAADAGSDQSLCGFSSTTLDGNNPNPAAGLWSIVSGSGGSFVNSGLYNTVFNGANGSGYTLRWTISNGSCSSSDDVVISFPVVASMPGEFTTYSSSVCRGSAGNIYTVPAETGVTYNWSYSGTGHTIIGTGNSVSITFSPSATGGNLGVTSTNSCGTSGARTLAVSMTDMTWTGSVSTDWNAAGNWSCGLLPSSSTPVQIPDVTNKPVIGPGATGSVNDLTIANGTSLTISGNTLQVSGTITNNGTLTASAGKIEFNGTSAQVIGANLFAGNQVKDLTINNAAGVTLQGTLDISGTLLVESGTLATGGYLTLLSTAAGTALIDGSGSGTVSGAVTMQRYLPSGFGYKYFSSPFQAATVSEFSDDMTLGAFTFYRYDENRTSSGWLSYSTPANILNPMQGYAVNFGSNHAAKTADVTGIVNNGTIAVTLYNHNYTYTKGFNLVGNPYPSPVDWDAVKLNNIDIDDAVYYFKASTTDQYGGTYSTYINGVSSDGVVNNIIPSMQGFFVHVSDGSYPVSGSLTMTNADRLTDLTQPFAAKMGSEQEASLLRLEIIFTDDLNSADPMVIYIDEKGTNGFDNRIDALKLLNTDLKVPNLYAMSPDGAKLSINAIPPLVYDLRVIPLGLKLNRAGTVSFRIRDIEESIASKRIYITDNVTGIEKDLLAGGEYTVTLDKAEYNSRFFLNLSNLPTGFREPVAKTELFSVYSAGPVVRAEIYNLQGDEGTLTIFNLSGQALFITKINNPGYHEFNPGLRDGIYIVNYTTGVFRGSKKLVIQDR
jgi:hypothetical protein